VAALALPNMDFIPQGVGAAGLQAVARGHHGVAFGRPAGPPHQAVAVGLQQRDQRVAHPGLVEIAMIDRAELAHQAEQFGQV
jgi:hypothetical protein